MIELIEAMQRNRIWHEEPVVSFTSDVDWASETVLDKFFPIINPEKLKLTVFVTHPSLIINKYYKEGKIERGLHPNFLANSSHGDTYSDVIKTSLSFAPEALCFRNHRVFDTTQVSHMLYENGLRYDSNLVTVMQSNIFPLLHESGLIRLPVFVEDGTCLYNKLDLTFKSYQKFFDSPGLKIISIHPMNYVINPPTLNYMRNIKDSLSREEYQSFDQKQVAYCRNKGSGIRDFIDEIITWSAQRRVMSLSEIYRNILTGE